MKSVIIVAMDGLQPAQVTAELMPNLSAFAADGVRFLKHHAAYPSVTRTNVVSLLTGRHPGANGLAANVMLARDLDSGRVFETSWQVLTEFKERGGSILLVPNLADILGQNGGEYVAIGTGTTGNAFLHNPNWDRSGGATIHPEFSNPPGLNDELEQRFGPWPEASQPNSQRIDHGFRLLADYVLAERQPTVALLWSSDPDGIQHATGVGSKASREALANVDSNFGRLMEWLAKRGRDHDTDVVVVSDHGYSTITRPVEIALRQNGFPESGRPGGVLVASNGGSILLYVSGRDAATARRLANHLMAQPWSGALIASDELGEIEGTIPASTVGIEGPRAPNIAMSFRWDSRVNEAGFAGYAYNSGAAPDLGMHGSMSRHEMRPVLIARGPSFKSGVVSAVPSGNIDLTPTLLSILGIDPGIPMDGRVLEESLTNGPDPGSVESTTESFEAESTTGSGVYRQYVSISSVGTTRYVSEGNRMEEA